MKVAGCMTGTSADGIDIVVCEIHGQPPELDITPLHHATAAMPQAVRDIILRSTGLPLSAKDYARLEYHLSDAISTLARKAHDIAKFELFGIHGQTLWHLPPPNINPLTHQVLNPYKITQSLNVPVVWDFRRADVSAGGQGAPLAPFAHFCLFGGGMDSVGVLNIGGIANLTVLPSGIDPSRIRAWDIGPGMMLIDHFARTNFDVRFDDNGDIAAQGKVNKQLLAYALDHPYFAELTPKTCGRETFGADYASQFAHFSRELNIQPQDILRTAVALTTQTIADAVVDENLSQLIIAGGGARNRTLLTELQSRMPKTGVTLSDSLDIPCEQLEAIAFAIFAYERWHQRPTNLPSVTGALESVLLGSIAL